eukprot:851865-Prorocentrum_lima.AAC.1
MDVYRQIRTAWKFYQTDGSYITTRNYNRGLRSTFATDFRRTNRTLKRRQARRLNRSSCTRTSDITVPTRHPPQGPQGPQERSVSNDKLPLKTTIRSATLNI